jgi:hypothetical protein
LGLNLLLLLIKIGLEVGKIFLRDNWFFLEDGYFFLRDGQKEDIILIGVRL